MHDTMLLNAPAPSTTRANAWLAAVTILALALRLWRLDAQPLWLDEVASTYNAEAFGMGGLTSLAALDHVAPLHSMVLWLVTELGGRSAFWLRLPSALVGSLAVPLVYLICIRLKLDRTVALTSTILMAISPLAIWYSQEARMYALLLLCSCAHAALTVPLFHRSLTLTEWLGLIAVTVTGLYTHHFMALQMVAFAVVVALTLGPSVLRSWIWLASQMTASVAFSFWIVLTADKLQANAGFGKPSALLWIPYSLFNFAYGFSLGPSVREIRQEASVVTIAQHGAEIVLGLAAVLTILGIGCVQACRRGPRGPAHTLLVWAALPLLLAIGATFVTNIAFNTRYVVMSLPPVLILLAVGLVTSFRAGFRDEWQAPLLLHFQDGHRRGRRTLAFCASGLLLFGMMLSVANWLFAAVAYSKEDVRPLVWLIAQAPASRLVVADNSRILMLLRYYGAQLALETPAIDNIEYGRTPEMVIGVVRSILELNGSREVWLLQYRSWESDPLAHLRTWLDSSTNFLTATQWTGVSLRRYVVPHALAPGGGTPGADQGINSR